MLDDVLFWLVSATAWKSKNNNLNKIMKIFQGVKVISSLQSNEVYKHYVSKN